MGTRAYRMTAALALVSATIACASCSTALGGDPAPPASGGGGSGGHDTTGGNHAGTSGGGSTGTAAGGNGGGDAGGGGAAACAPPVTSVWSLSFGGSFWDIIADLEVGPNDTIVAGGLDASPHDFMFSGDPSGPYGDPTNTDVDGEDAFVVAYSEGGQFVFGHLLGGDALNCATTGPQQLRGVAVDSLGNTFLTGRFKCDIFFGAVDPACTDCLYAPPSQGHDLFVAKLDPEGDHLWSYAFGDTSAQTGLGLEPTPDGGVILYGHHQGVLDFVGNGGSGPGVLTVPAGQIFQGYIAKLDADGQHQWSLGIPGICPDSRPRCGKVAVRADGASYWATYVDAAHDNLVQLAGLPPTHCGCDNNPIVVMFDPNGAPQWSRCVGVCPIGQSTINEADVTLGDDGRLTVVGNFQGTVTFGGPNGSDVATDLDGYVLDLDASDGATLGSLTLGHLGDQAPAAVASGPDGSLSIAGAFTGTLSLEPCLFNQVDADSTDIFLLRLAQDRTVLGAASFGNGEVLTVDSLVRAPSGALILGGSFRGNLDFGSGALASIAGAEDAFIAKFLVSP